MKNIVSLCLILFLVKASSNLPLGNELKESREEAVAQALLQIKKFELNAAYTYVRKRLGVEFLNITIAEVEQGAKDFITKKIEELDTQVRKAEDLAEKLKINIGSCVDEAEESKKTTLNLGNITDCKDSLSWIPLQSHMKILGEMKTTPDLILPTCLNNLSIDEMKMCVQERMDIFNKEMVTITSDIDKEVQNLGRLANDCIQKTQDKLYQTSVNISDKFQKCTDYLH